MWNGKMKAVTFSYDDGVIQDGRLVDMFNRYGLKCTFNLNSGIQSKANFWYDRMGTKVEHMNVRGLKELYVGHEIAAHTLTHPHLEELDDETVYNEIWQDKCILEDRFGQNIVGMAYPYGTYNDSIIKIARECGIKYARTVEYTEDFILPDEPLKLAATCHHKNPRLMELADKFIGLEPKQPAMFYVWGHSYEFDTYDNWDMMEEFCKKISGRDDIFYGTNAEVLLGVEKV